MDQNNKIVINFNSSLDVFLEKLKNQVKKIKKNSSLETFICDLLDEVIKNFLQCVENYYGEEFRTLGYVRIRIGSQYYFLTESSFTDFKDVSVTDFQRILDLKGYPFIDLAPLELSIS